MVSEQENDQYFYAFVHVNVTIYWLFSGVKCEQNPRDTAPLSLKIVE